MNQPSNYCTSVYQENCKYMRPGILMTTGLLFWGQSWSVCVCSVCPAFLCLYSCFYRIKLCFTVFSNPESAVLPLSDGFYECYILVYNCHTSTTQKASSMLLFSFFLPESANGVESI